MKNMINERLDIMVETADFICRGGFVYEPIADLSWEWNEW